MEKKLKRIQTQRNDRLKDRGDMQRKRFHKEVELQKHPPDRGDLKFRLLKPEDDQKKLKQSSPLKLVHVTAFVTKSTNTCEVPKLMRKVDKPESTEFRQRIRDRYTLKPKGNLKVQIKKDEQFSFVQDDLSSKCHFCGEASESTDRAKQCPETKSERSTKLRRPAKRKPIRKTSKHVVRVRKVLTFMETNSRPYQIRTPHREPLIRLPRVVKRRASIETSKVSDKPAVKRPRRITRPRVDNRLRYIPSPELSHAEIVSPPTEVAKWTAASVNKHTRPYYEAWVDTTLAAISKFSKKDKLYIEKQKVLQTFKKELQRQLSPELVYKNIADEKYAGKIRVRQRL